MKFMTLAQAEANAIDAAMHECKGNKTKAALLLGISVPVLYFLLKEYGFTEYLIQTKKIHLVK